DVRVAVTEHVHPSVRRRRPRGGTRGERDDGDSQGEEASGHDAASIGEICVICASKREERFVTRAIAVLGTAVALFSSSSLAHADELTADLQARRARVMSALDPQTMFIAWSAPPAVYSRDVNYVYRQDSNMLYLTGVDQEGAVLVLMPGNDKA